MRQFGRKINYLVWWKAGIKQLLVANLNWTGASERHESAVFWIYNLDRRFVWRISDSLFLKNSLKFADRFSLFPLETVTILLKLFRYVSRYVKKTPACWQTVINCIKIEKVTNLKSDTYWLLIRINCGIKILSTRKTFAAKKTRSITWKNTVLVSVQSRLRWPTCFIREV